MAIFMFGLAVVLILAGIIVFFVGQKYKLDFSGVGSFIMAAAGVVLMAFSSTTIVQARDVGVGVAFGQPTEVYENGLHFKRPWESVEILDGAVQNDIYTGESTISVRLGNNSRATAETSIQWRLKTDDAINIYRDYRTFDNIRSNLVDRNFRTALNEVMASYNPLNAEDVAQGGADLSALSTEVEEKMVENIGEQVDIRAVNITLINFDDATQTRIDELQGEIARTRVAEQRQNTAEAEAEANALLEESVTEEVLISKCLDIVEASGQSPIGCFPGSSPQALTMVDDAPVSSSNDD